MQMLNLLSGQQRHGQFHQMLRLPFIPELKYGQYNVNGENILLQKPYLTLCRSTGLG